MKDRGGPCGEHCPERHPGCQNPETCEKWRVFQAKWREEKKERLRALREAADYSGARKFKQKRWRRER